MRGKSIIILVHALCLKWSQSADPPTCPPAAQMAAAISKGWCNPPSISCPSGTICCPRYNNVPPHVCVQAWNQPVVTQILNGSQVQQGLTLTFVASVALIQSKGFNILVDTSTAGQAQTVWTNLYKLKLLTTDNINLLVTTHGHPDHYANNYPFNDRTTQIFDKFTSTKNNFLINALALGQRLFINNDTNIEVVETPGHTLQDVTVIVTNEATHGTVAITGDLFLFKDDGGDSAAQNKTLSDLNRQKIACSVDWIVPGHGPMFQMDANQRAKFNCTN